MSKTPFSPRSVTYESRTYSSYFGSLEQYCGTNSKKHKNIKGRVTVDGSMAFWGVLSLNKMINFAIIFCISVEISNESCFGVSVVCLADCRIINEFSFCESKGEKDKKIKML